MELALDLESAQHLRDFAQDLREAPEEILEATEELNKKYTALADDCGVHAEDIADILTRIKAAADSATEAIEPLPGKLEETADGIEEYVAQNISI